MYIYFFCLISLVFSSNDFGQLARYEPPFKTPKIIEFFQNLAPITDIACGKHFSVAVTGEKKNTNCSKLLKVKKIEIAIFCEKTKRKNVADGTCLSWGENTFGQLSIGEFGVHRAKPGKISSDLFQVRKFVFVLFFFCSELLFKKMK